MLKRREYLWFIALFVAWSFDLFFWRKSPGISIPIFVTLSLGGGFFLARREEKPPANFSLLLLLPIAIFSIMTLFRREPFTLFVSTVLVLGSMWLLVLSFRGGRWATYSLSDYGAGGFRLFASVLVLPQKERKLARERSSENTTTDQRFTLKFLLPVARGFLLALPIVAIFAALLSSADPVFENRFRDFLELFNLENLPEYLFRGFYILVLAYGLAGVYLHALIESKDEKLIGLEKPWLPPFLGFTESVIILGSVNVLFGAFVGIQFQYFFGGQVNISIEGYTYAEYARRGFGELVTVAMFSLLLFLGLSAVTRRQDTRQRKSFSVLGVLLTFMVGVILTSAFQRLLLYESAFGFTRLRTYPHIFMIWLGILLAAFVALEILGRQRLFGLAVLIAALGFGVSLNIINVDGLVVRQNVSRAQAGAELDTSYLLTLSTDATSDLIAYFTSPELDPELKNELGLVLACQYAKELERQKTLSWPSFHFTDRRALNLLSLYDNLLSNYPTQKDSGRWVVTFQGEERSCETYFID